MSGAGVGLWAAATVLLSLDLPPEMQEPGGRTALTLEARNISDHIVVLGRIVSRGSLQSFDLRFGVPRPDSKRPRPVMAERYNVLLPGAVRRFSAEIALRPGRHRLDLTLDYALHSDGWLKQALVEMPSGDAVRAWPPPSGAHYHAFGSGRDPLRKPAQATLSREVTVTAHPVVQAIRQQMPVTDFSDSLTHFGLALRSGAATWLIADGRREAIGDVALGALGTLDAAWPGPFVIFVQMRGEAFATAFGDRVESGFMPMPLPAGSAKRTQMMPVIRLDPTDLPALWAVMSGDGATLALIGDELVMTRIRGTR